MFQVAVYGKGGIGKSTMSANTSVALARRGAKVMQIGCDPKHDSTRLLLGGRTQQTVLDYVRDTPVGRRKLEDVIETGTDGILCAEAGGPEPGIGCAGRGILTTFETLSRLGADDLDVDIRIYDVLGDVVCGGFAVPLRREHADGVILVTSGEFMSIYAANNIMKGMLNFDAGRPRLLGIVFNSRGGPGELEAVRRFAEASRTEVICRIPRDRLFAEAESKGHTLMELYPDSEPAHRLEELADRIIAASRGEAPLYEPVPLDDDQMADLAAGRPIRPGKGVPDHRTLCTGCRTTIKGTRVMSSCAAYGAVSALTRAGGSTVIVHGPMSCMYLMGTTHAKAVLDLYERGILRGRPEYGLVSTRMDDSAAIFGGNRFLEDALDRAYRDGSRSMSVVTTCMPAIIGDDCRAVLDSFKASHPEVRLELVRAEGDIAGEYTDGFMLAAEVLAQRIDTSVEPDPGYVNIIATSFFDMQSRAGMESLSRMLGVFGLNVNCRFIDDASPAPIEMLCRGSTDILINDTRNTRELMGIIARRTGRTPFPAVMPLGIHDYIAWIEEMGRFTSMTAEAEAEVARARAEYGALAAVHRPRMEGVRIIVMWKMGGNPDWLIDTLHDVGAEVLRVGFCPSTRKAGGSPDSRYDVVGDYTEERLAEDIAALHPDILISDIIRRVPPEVRFARLSKMGIGYVQVFDYIQYLESLMRLPEKEGWRMTG